MADDVQDTPLAQRLMARNAGGPGLHRVSMPDGGEAYSGPLANRALKALGARAFTVDKSVIVDRAFDRAKGEDQALYAHERFHQRESDHKAEGDEGASHGGKDAEEMAARAIESMVLHRSAQGEDFGSIMGDVNSGAMDDAAKDGGGENDPKKTKVSGALIGGGKDRDPMEGYKAMIKDGLNHWQIVGELKDHVVSTLDRINEEHEFRSAESSFLTGGH